MLYWPQLHDKFMKAQVHSHLVVEPIVNFSTFTNAETTGSHKRIKSDKQSWSKRDWGVLSGGFIRGLNHHLITPQYEAHWVLNIHDHGLMGGGWNIRISMKCSWKDAKWSKSCILMLIKNVLLNLGLLIKKMHKLMNIDDHYVITL